MKFLKNLSIPLTTISLDNTSTIRSPSGTSSDSISHHRRYIRRRTTDVFYSNPNSTCYHYHPGIVRRLALSDSSEEMDEDFEEDSMSEDSESSNQD